MFDFAGLMSGAALAGPILGYLGGRESNDANVNMTNAMNAANLQATRETNANEYAMMREATEESKKMALDAWNRSNTSAREQMDFQRQMSNTAYQRATADMRAAGLNPMLAFQQGGASSPAGASATASTGTASKGNAAQARYSAAHINNVMEGFNTTGLDIARLVKDIKATDSTINLNKAQTEVAKAQKRLTENSAKTVEVQIPAKAAQAKVDRKTAEIDEKAVLYDSTIERLLDVIGSVFSGRSRKKR